MGAAALLAAGGLATGPVLAQTSPPGLEPIDAPPPPPSVHSGETLEPEITIVQRRDALVYEYRVGGRLIAVKITPAGGIPYYLVDIDGDGDLESRRDDLASEILVNTWVLFTW